MVLHIYCRKSLKIPSIHRNWEALLIFFLINRLTWAYNLKRICLFILLLN